MIKLKAIILESMDLQKYVPNLQHTKDFNDFLKSLVGRRLSDILDGASFARLYIGNKYGVGGEPDKNDVQHLMSELLSWTTSFINYRKIEPLRSQLDKTDAEEKKSPAYQEYSQKRASLMRAVINARKSGDVKGGEEARKQQAALVVPTSYSKNMDDMQVLIKKFHTTPLTLQDVMPSPHDRPTDKERYEKAKEAFETLKSSMR
jgi:hypothetical protein